MPEIRIGFSDDSYRVIARYKRIEGELRRELRGALRQGLEETAGHLQSTYLRGGSVKSPRGGRPPLAVRSGALLGSIAAKVDQPLSGFVGVISGAATKYARVQLGGGKTTIKPVNAKHLWIPIADNLSPSGQMRMSPREAMEARTVTGKRALRIFKSKRGNLVAFLPEGREASNLQTRQEGLALTGERYARGKNKGRLKGKLLFVLRDQVEVQGTDALATAVTDKTPRIGELVNEAIRRAFGGGYA